MTGKISPKVPDNNDPAAQYSKGVPQYDSGDGSDPAGFQSYMNDGLTQGTHSTSPMDMMSQTQDSNFGAPGTAPDFAAPENFGPPGVSQTTDSQGSSFGPPGDDPSSGEGLASQGAAKSTGSNATPGFGAPQNTGQNADNNLLGAPKGGGGGGSGGAQKKKHTYAEVEKMEANNMLNNAMQQMKVKDPDPEAWQ